MLERLKALNPSLPLFSVDSPEFAEYGRVLSGFDATAFVKAADTRQNASFAVRQSKEGRPDDE